MGLAPRASMTGTHAFGMAVGADFPIPGLEPHALRQLPRQLSLGLAEPAEIEADWPGDSAERVVELRFDDGSLAVSVDSAGELGFLAYAFDFGKARIDPDGRRVRIAPADEQPWIWQRYLTGQVLPLAALLQGLEVFHASVVVRDGKALAVAGNSGAGKTTLALNLALRGLSYLSDDVLTVELQGPEPIAHPGIGLANVKSGNDDLLAMVQREGLAAPIGARGRETRLSLSCSEDPVPLRAIFFVNRFKDERPLKIERLSPVDPRVLLAATFNFSVRSPERLARQLEVCAAVERRAEIFRITCGSHVPPSEVADVILDQPVEALEVSG